ncbi:hypothetical protein I5I01_gp26 [Mycobacterium phage MooMoo]|uniref:Lipoprotein n=1 Tax=Mycobacterium phage MooMoo TaxID=2108127 RepID=A0A2P1JRA6_9CAUD|nr:hypothetical protein I5I01_gp26 [Mycobacterium phage MooMoo]AVO21632.1 hypothetical protein SEA_MOOMOO_26 [Mycobacterium phage MooMoo]
MRIRTTIGLGVLTGLGIAALISWMFATGCPLIDQVFIEKDTLFYF